jgi:hypothetical protein
MRRPRTLLLLPLLAAALAAMLAAGAGMGGLAQTATGPAVPEPIAAPADLVVVATLHAQGAQVYECRAGADGRLAWQFREPIATLLEGGRTVGRHYAGPSWELADGGAVVARVTGRAPGAGADDIPWLRLEVSERRGGGRLARVTVIQRVNTRGGVAEGACAAAGAFLSVAYATDYVFLAPRQ